MDGAEYIRVLACESSIDVECRCDARREKFNAGRNNGFATLVLVLDSSLDYKKCRDKYLRVQTEIALRSRPKACVKRNIVQWTRRYLNACQKRE